MYKKNIQEAISKSIKKGEISGANLLIMKDGKEVFYYEDGFASIEKEEKIKRNSIFRLYSMSKPITSLATMILMERGVFDIYEPVSKYIDGFKNQKVAIGEKLVPVEREMRIKDLLNMTSGMLYGGQCVSGMATSKVIGEMEEKLFTTKAYSTVEAANKLGQCPLAFQPGSDFAYGTSADILGAVIEVASGMKFGDFLKKEIFEPLEMHDTDFFVPENKRERLVNTYEVDQHGKLGVYTGNNLCVTQKMEKQPSFQSGGAGLVSTIDDSSKFTQLLMNNGMYNNKKIINSKTVKYMTTKALNVNQQKSFNNWYELEGHSYGNLMRVMTDVNKCGTIGCQNEYGWDGWLGCYFTNCPDENLNFIFMTQKKDGGTMEITRKLRNIIISSCS